MIREVLVTCGILAALASIMIPLPPGVLDFLLVSNLVLAGVLLVNALAVSEPLKLSSLPTLLLLCTLFRLALNISTTRLILTTGNAGETVQAFGTMVIAGSIAVGIVIFLVITVIQFIVVAKGAERVAEVAARFTLDALPGKQMSIDADVRSGLIDAQQARQRRNDLQVESRFYGALDGAMKFIKGDAIAGVLITIINLVGGVLISLAATESSFGVTFSHYAVLIVGDGLLSQIPALLNALAAGLVVTRVARGDEASLAKELFSQLGQMRRVKMLIGILACGAAFVPGFPTLPFLFLGLFLLGSAILHQEEVHPQVARPQFRPTVPTLLQLRVPLAMANLAKREAREEIRQKLFQATGILVREIEILPEEDRTLVALSIRGTLRKEHSLSEEKISHDGIVQIIQPFAAELIDDGMTRRLLGMLEEESPDLSSSLVPAVIPVATVTFVLRSLLAEEVSIRSLDLIMQALAELGTKAARSEMTVAEVRVALRFQIRDRYADAEGVIRASMLAPAVDQRCQSLLSQVATDPQLAAFEVRELLAPLAEELRGSVLPLLCSKGVRATVRQIVQARGIKVPVLALDEVHDGPVVVDQLIGREMSLRRAA